MGRIAVSWDRVRRTPQETPKVPRKRNLITAEKAEQLLKDTFTDPKYHFKARTIRKAAQQGKLRATRMSERVVMFYDTDVLEWAQSEELHKSGPKPE